MVVTAPLRTQIVDVVKVLDTRDQSCHPAVARVITSVKIRFLAAAAHQAIVAAAVHQKAVAVVAHQKAVPVAVRKIVIVVERS